MAKAKDLYVCRECGYETVKWMGKCPVSYTHLDVYKRQIITSKGAGTAFQFAFALAEAICSPGRAEHLKAGIQWQE